MEAIAQATLNLYLTINGDDVQDDGVEELADLVAGFASDYGLPGMEYDGLVDALREAVAEYYDE